MKILAVTFDTELSGGANRSFLMVISELKKTYGHDIHTIIPGEGPIEKELERMEFSYEKVFLCQTGLLLMHNAKDFLRKMKANAKAFIHYMKACQMKRRLKKENYDIVYINGTSQLFGYYVAKKLKLPFVWHFRGAHCKESYYTWKQRKMFNDPNGKVIVISTSMYEELPITIGVEKRQMKMIHNGLQLGKGIHSLQNRECGIHCVLCGRLTRGKGQAEAIEALHLLHDIGQTNVYLHFAGDVKNAYQPYVNMLRKKISEYHLEKFVIFEGQISDMEEFRRNMNIELVCSICEPFGRVTVEGMRSGLVVIGANTGGTLDIIKDKYNGLLYKQGNPKDLAMKIQCVIENENFAKNLAEVAREFSKMHFTMEQNVSQINQLLIEQAQMK